MCIQTPIWRNTKEVQFVSPMKNTLYGTWILIAYNHCQEYMMEHLLQLTLQTLNDMILGVKH